MIPISYLILLFITNPFLLSQSKIFSICSLHICWKDDLFSCARRSWSPTRTWRTWTWWRRRWTSSGPGRASPSTASASSLSGSTYLPTWSLGALLLCPCLLLPSDNVWRSRRADAPRCAHFSTVISPSWITEQISVGKCAHQGASQHQERQTSFKIVTWTKQTWTKHHNTDLSTKNLMRLLL